MSVKDQNENKVFSVEVVIPAYNEEANIKYIIQSILDQKGDNFILEKITVISDGSTDDTVRLVQSMKDSRIKILEFSERRGMCPVLKEFFPTISADILIKCDGDVILEKDSIYEAVKEFSKDDNLYLLCADNKPLMQIKTYLDKLIYIGEDIWRQIKDLTSENTLLWRCTGRCYILRGEFIKKLSFKAKIADDRFIFFSTLLTGKKIIYSNKVGVIFKLPSSYQDFLNQSSRYIDQEDDRLFPEDLVNKYKINSTLSDKIKILYFGLKKYDIHFICFMILRFFDGIIRRFIATDKVWKISNSTKKLIN